MPYRYGVSDSSYPISTTTPEPSLSKAEKQYLTLLINTGGYISHIGSALLQNPDFQDFLTTHFKTQYSNTLKLFNKEKKGFVSVLMKKKEEDLTNFSWHNICQEFSEHFPLVFNILSAMMSQNEEKNQQCIFPKLGMIYGICSQSRNLVQFEE